MTTPRARSSARRLAMASLAVLVSAAPACSVDALAGAGYVGPQNGCTEDAACGAGASCTDGACVATKASYPFFLEVTPPTTAHFAPDTTFAQCSADTSGGERDVDLPAPALVSARIDAPAVTCTSGKPLGVKLRLVRQGALPGAATSVFEATGAPSDANPDGVTIAVAPGTYDVWVAPTDGCALERIPPYPLGSRTFLSGAQKLVVAYSANLPQFQVSLVDENGDPLAPAGSSEPIEARDLSLIDTTTGQTISTVAHTCGHESSATLTLAPVVARDPNDPLTHAYVLRIDPPRTSCDGVAPPHVEPSYDVDFAGLLVEGTLSGTVAVQRASMATFVSAVGRVSAVVSGAAVPATVVLRSTSLVMPTNARFGTPFYVATADTLTSGGEYLVQAPPGTYHATVVPDAKSAYAVWAADVTLDPKKAIDTITVPPKAPVQALITAPNGSVFTLGSVDALAIVDTSPGALPSRSQSAPFTLVKDPSDPTGATWLRSFSVSLDRGQYDVVARVPEASGFPWLLLPQLDVPQPTTSHPAVALGPIAVSSPVRLSGVVRDPNGDPVAHATVRARAVIGASAKSDASTCSFPDGHAVAIAETQTDDAGNYTLAVPSEVAVVHRDGGS